MRVGVDFGTTRTVVAAVDRGNYPIVGFHGEEETLDWFPSLVAERGGELRFGLAAQAVAGDPEWTVVRSFKRRLGDPDASLATEIEIGGVTLPLVELCARYLGALREAIAFGSNAPSKGKKKGGPIEAVIAVPANAHGTQRFLTIDAFRRAGFDVIALVNEPSAAGFEYTHRHRDTITSRREHIVVYDLGGGTFDASLVRMSGTRHDVIATAGINHLGGDDFDEALLDLAKKAAKVKRLARGARDRLLDQCRAAKESLNANSRKIALDVEGTEVSIPVADYYEACAPLVARTMEAMAPVMATLEGDAPEEGLAGIYVVGGGSALPVVGRQLKERWGRRVHRSPYPFAATAIGLAIAADGEAGLVLADRLSRHMGVYREAESGARLAFDPILGPDTAVPHGDAPAAFVRRYRAAHNVGHFRFVECAAFDDAGPRGDITPVREVLFAFDPALRGRRDLGQVPVERRDEGPLVEEQYRVDPNGMVEVRITDLDTGYGETYRLGG